MGSRDLVKGVHFVDLCVNQTPPLFPPSLYMADLPPPPIPPPVGEEASLRHSLSSSSLENPEIAPEEEGEEVSPEIIAAENISRLLAELEISSKELGASFVNVVTSTQDSMDEVGLSFPSRCLPLKDLRMVPNTLRQPFSASVVCAMSQITSLTTQYLEHMFKASVVSAVLFAHPWPHSRVLYLLIHTPSPSSCFFAVIDVLFVFGPADHSGIRGGGPGSGRTLRQALHGAGQGPGSAPESAKTAC